MKKTIGLLIFSFLLAYPGFSAEPGREYKIKAGFIHKLLFFAQWPDNALLQQKDTMTIGFIGKNPFGDLFKIIEGKTVKNKTIVTKYFDKETTFDIYSQCHILFVCASEKGRIKDILDSLKGLPVLTVSEIDEFIDAGGVINFIMQKNNVRFEVNKKRADEVGLKLRSKLLRVAVRIIED